MSKTNQSFRLTDENALSNCYAHIAHLYAQNKDKTKSLTVSIELQSDDKIRSLAQNRLYWKWVKVISDYTGLSKDEQHNQLKYQHLARIYNRDDPKIADILNQVKSVKNQVPLSTYYNLTLHVSSLLSTTKATTKQMSEYLDDIDKYFFQEGVILPKPNDYNWIIERDYD